MELADFIDMHCHILPGLDDGPKKPSQCLALVRCYAAVGIKKLVATPHFIPGTIWTARPRRILDLINRLQQALRRNGFELEIFPGMEISIQKNMGARLAQGAYLPLGASDAYLLEPPFEISGLNPLEPLAEFMEQGKKVILAHPERCEYFQQHPQILKQAQRRGIAIQLNYGSLLGHFGPAAEKLARRLLEWDAVDYLASDAHSAGRRRPPDQADWQELKKLMAPEILRRIAADNPGKLLA
jgi:protein-tyrosine phosphatase